ncbi:MAG: hypothetical protein ACI837_003591 [Crocinitomicaceae bacterium]|jgi:hypothetical protein
MKKLLFLLVFLCSSISFSQTLIKKKRATEKQLEIMTDVGVNSMVILDSETEDEDYSQILIQDKKSKKWGMFIRTYSSSSRWEFFIKPIYDSVGFHVEPHPAIVVKKGDKYGLFALRTSELATLKRPLIQFDEVQFKTTQHAVYSLVKKNEKWGLFLPSYNQLAVPCQYKSVEDVPLFRIDDWLFEYFLKLKVSKEVIYLRPDPNGDGVFQVAGRNKKWGLYQMDRLIIPMAFDSIVPLSWNAPFVVVYNNGKAGVYADPFGDSASTSTIKCIYDEAVRVTSNGYFYCAIRVGNKWGYVDWYTGEIQLKPSYESVKALPAPRGFHSSYYD